MNHISKTLAIAAALAAVSADAVRAQQAYALTNNGGTLVSFQLATPGTMLVVGNLAGAVTAVNGLDFRPANNLLYGYDSGSNSIVTIDTTTGATTLVATPSAGAGGAIVGVDFNPAADRLRLVNPGDQNLRVNLAGGATTVDGTLAYAAGDPNAGQNPNIGEVAYTNNDVNPGTGTTLYYIDTTQNTLVSTTNPNGGVLNTVGALGVDVGANLGFDIFTNSLGVNSAYALFDVGGTTGLFSIDLLTGSATSLGAFGGAGAFGLAIAPIPEPGSLALLAGAAAAGLALRRRRRRA